MEQVDDSTVKMVQNTNTGMVSPPKAASKFIMQVRDEATGALMITLPIDQDDFDFLNLIVEKKVFTGSIARKAMISSVVKGESTVEKVFTSEDATKREFSRGF